jgi:DNA repair protein RadC
MTHATEEDKSGHRQRIRERFFTGEDRALSEESLLELLLTFAIPRKDVRPLAKDLLARFGSLSGVLEADPIALCASEGIKDNSAVLIKLVDAIRQNGASKLPTQRAAKAKSKSEQPPLFEAQEDDRGPAELEKKSRGRAKRTTSARRGTGLFGKAILKEAIEMLPQLPDTESLKELRLFLNSNLHFSGEQTRQRYASYILSRMFPDGHGDRALRAFAWRYEGRQELRDACFYRFCKAEPLMYKVIGELFIPSIGAGRLNREGLRAYLAHQYPEAKSIKDNAQAITEALEDSGVAKADRTRITFGYREILIPSFAFVVHNEFPEPGMYSIEQLENSQALRAMFWNPDRVLNALYELRNLGLIARVSEIDRVRQFTTKWSLDQLVERLVSERVGV